MTFDCAFVQCATQTSHLTTTIRGLDGKVLRVYNFDFGQPWEWVRDYVYRDGQLLASVEPDGGGEATSHFHLDHLGSPRQITDGGAVETSIHTYYPFGGEATDPAQDEVGLKFTGHERDMNGSLDAGMLDYMHARYCSPKLARFLSPDRVPVPREALGLPNRWNRYSYGASNPIKYVDPSGNYVVLYFSQPGEEAELLGLFKEILRNAGASVEASQLALANVGDEVRLAMETDFSGSTNAVAGLLGSAIKTSKRLSFRLDLEGLEDHGGGLTDSTSLREIKISLNPNVVKRLRVPGTAVSGPASGFSMSPAIDDNLLVPVSFEAAVVHEFGHAFGIFGKGSIPNVGGNTTPWALKYENHYRRLSGERFIRSLQGEDGVLLNSRQ
ncbi:MAG: RHS repeat-associated core domain-containing protein [bacterium]|nr:RHS repeat-associated core domain-containing protein [bacterium]